MVTIYCFLKNPKRISGSIRYLNARNLQLRECLADLQADSGAAFAARRVSYLNTSGGAGSAPNAPPVAFPFTCCKQCVFLHAKNKTFIYLPLEVPEVRKLQLRECLAGLQADSDAIFATRRLR
jgi:hypothetical protein